ncbi:deoxyribodipyrimidine photo-lyase [Flagellimonas sp. DF-77]|uniref:cryptochrome/photolyase family protein n=1 Tax=Flagellimonas algarum TaxID=3230298 RepID=UPI003390E21E
MGKRVAVFWFRRDLRLDDNVGFYNALKGDVPVIPLFIFDPELLAKLPKDDPRVYFIFRALNTMQAELKAHQSGGMYIAYGKPEAIFEQLMTDYQLETVYTNHDYEPYANKRDGHIAALLSENKVGFKTFKDQVIFEKGEVTKDDGAPYVVYTPYKNRWKSQFNPALQLIEYDTLSILGNCYSGPLPSPVSLAEMGFQDASISVPDFVATKELIENYEATRNFPAKEKGTSRLGPHLRFGTVSIRKMMRKAIASKNEVFWSELIWREFFMQILWHFPHTVDRAFKPKYDRIAWRNDPDDFERWKTGMTGYHLVDAGMRELNATGYMHNRVRMLVASFLCKHLLIDWRWGEAYFAEKLLDFELASNVGNWQWAAGSGVDAAPYFRIFNPTTQVQKFDKQQTYIQKWVPELNELTYPLPMVDHKFARERCLETYKAAVG